AESNSRFLCEVAEEHANDFELAMSAVAHSHIGTVTSEARVVITAGDRTLVSERLDALKSAWQDPLAW
ncbi:MAG: hypothetical protein KDA60_08925, partial [Planctomycetales bacterium]|nr:hypothetical protein [Planctomycetales bacterium]